MSEISTRTATQVDDGVIEVMRATSGVLITFVALLIGVGMLDLSDRWASRVGQLWFVALVLQGALWASRGVAIGTRRYAERHAGPDASPVSAAATLFSWGLRTVLWTVVVLAMLSNIGVNITAFVASLGVGGIAIALAAQQVLGDLFASVAIAVDKPFDVGDFITFTGVAGTVEAVGIKTTRIRSLGGERCEVLAAFGIEFAFPTRTVRIQNESAVMDVSGTLTNDRAAQPQGIADHGHGTQAHRQRGNHR